MNPLFKERLAFVGNILLAILIACSLFLLGFYALSWLIVRLLYLFENKGIVEHFVTGITVFYITVLILMSLYVLYYVWLFIKWLLVEPFQFNKKM